MAKKDSDTALSIGRPLDEKDCTTPYFCRREVKADDVYCFPLSLWNVSPIGSPRSRTAFLRDEQNAVRKKTLLEGTR